MKGRLEVNGEGLELKYWEGERKVGSEWGGIGGEVGRDWKVGWK